MSNRAWVTLATNDSYGLGALVLAHSLRRAGSIYPAAVLITPSVTEAMRERLRAVFAEVVVVDVLDSRDAAHLALLQRPELGITFTKIHCWGLTQYEKCVFLDADTLVVQNCDELFEREELSAAPDVGWPDCFNSGVFVYKPSQETLEQLIKFAQERGSFDGGDQGLLNSFFSDWARGDINKHLPFLYNVTSAAFYSYIPALKHYGQNLKIIHFIGAAKPWLTQFNWESRSVDAPEHLREFLQLWWDLFVGQIHPQLDVTMVEEPDAFSALSLPDVTQHYTPVLDPESEFPWHHPDAQIQEDHQKPAVDLTEFHDPWAIYGGQIPSYKEEVTQNTLSGRAEDHEEMKKYAWDYQPPSQDYGSKTFSHKSESHHDHQEWQTYQHFDHSHRETQSQHHPSESHWEAQSQHSHQQVQDHTSYNYHQYPHENQHHSHEHQQQSYEHHQHSNDHHQQSYDHHQHSNDHHQQSYDHHQHSNDHHQHSYDHHQHSHDHHQHSNDHHQYHQHSHEQIHHSHEHSTHSHEPFQHTPEQYHHTQEHYHHTQPQEHQHHEDHFGQYHHDNKQEHFDQGHIDHPHDHQPMHDHLDQSEKQRTHESNHKKLESSESISHSTNNAQIIHHLHLHHYKVPDHVKHKEDENKIPSNEIEVTNGDLSESENDYHEDVRPIHPYDNFYLKHRAIIDSYGRKICTHEIPLTPKPSEPLHNECEDDTTLSLPEEIPLTNGHCEEQVSFTTFGTVSGVAGNLARVVPGAASSQREALDELTRRQGWEAGNIDYMGADSFENIWAKISQTLSKPRVSPPKQPSPPKEPSPPKQPSPPKEVPVEVAQEATVVDAASPPVSEPAPAEVKPESAPAVVEAAATVEAAPAPVESAPVPVESASVPVEVAPAPVEAAPALVETAPAPVKAAPAPFETTPALVEAAPIKAAPIEVAPVEASPAPVEASPAPVEATPAPVEVIPAPVKAAPVEATHAPVKAVPVEATPAPVKATPVPTEAAPVKAEVVEAPKSVETAFTLVGSAPAPVAVATKPAKKGPVASEPEPVPIPVEAAPAPQVEPVVAAEAPVANAAPQASEPKIPTTVEAASGPRPAEIPAPVEASAAAPKDPIEIPATVKSSAAGETPKKKTKKTEPALPPTPPESPKSEEKPAPVKAAKEAASPVAPLPVTTPEKSSEATASSDSPPLANTPSKDEAPKLPAAKSEERRKGGCKLQLKPPAAADPLPTPDSEVEDAASLATSIIASELRTPTVSSPASEPEPTSPPAPLQSQRLSVDEPEVPTPPVGAVSLAQIGVKTPKPKSSTAAQIESSVTEKAPNEPATPTEAAPKKKIVIRKVVKKDKEGASSAEAPVPPPRKKEKKPKEK